MLSESWLRRWSPGSTVRVGRRGEDDCRRRLVEDSCLLEGTERANKAKFVVVRIIRASNPEMANHAADGHLLRRGWRAKVECWHVGSGRFVPSAGEGQMRV